MKRNRSGAITDEREAVSFLLRQAGYEPDVREKILSDIFEKGSVRARRLLKEIQNHVARIGVVPFRIPDPNEVAGDVFVGEGPKGVLTSFSPWRVGDLSGYHITVFGRPGTGKTTLKRRIARTLKAAGEIQLHFEFKGEARKSGDFPEYRDSMIYFSVMGNADALQFCIAFLQRLKGETINNTAMRAGRHLSLAMGVHEETGGNYLFEAVRQTLKEVEEPCLWDLIRTFEDSMPAMRHPSYQSKQLIYTKLKIMCYALGRAAWSRRMPSPREWMESGVSIALDFENISAPYRRCIVGFLIDWMLDARRLDESLMEFRMRIYVDEAHEIYLRVPPGAEGGSKRLLEQVREMRSAGIGLFCATQERLPMSETVVNSSQVILCLGLSSGNEMRAVAGDMGLAGEEFEFMMRMPAYECVMVNRLPGGYAWPVGVRLQDMGTAEISKQEAKQRTLRIMEEKGLCFVCDRGEDRVHTKEIPLHEYLLIEIQAADAEGRYVDLIKGNMEKRFTSCHEHAKGKFNRIMKDLKDAGFAGTEPIALQRAGKRTVVFKYLPDGIEWLKQQGLEASARPSILHNLMVDVVEKSFGGHYRKKKEVMLGSARCDLLVSRTEGRDSGRRIFFEICLSNTEFENMNEVEGMIKADLLGDGMTEIVFVFRTKDEAMKHQRAVFGHLGKRGLPKDFIHFRPFYEYAEKVNLHG